jgi:hypothetical protein
MVMTYVLMVMTNVLMVTPYILIVMTNILMVMTCVLIVMTNVLMVIPYILIVMTNVLIVIPCVLIVMTNVLMVMIAILTKKASKPYTFGGRKRGIFIEDIIKGVLLGVEYGSFIFKTQQGEETLPWFINIVYFCRL